MNRLPEMTQTHIRHLAADYVLDLLSAEEKKGVEEHSLECAACREEILTDRRLAGSIRLAVHSAGRTPARRLQQLMPQPPGSTPAGHPILSIRLTGTHRSGVLALCMLVFMLSVGSVLLGGYRSQQALSPTGEATLLAATATDMATTATAVPSATSISTRSVGVDSIYWSEAARQSPSPAGPQAVSTPVADVILLELSNLH